MLSPNVELLQHDARPGVSGGSGRLAFGVAVGLATGSLIALTPAASSLRLTVAPTTTPATPALQNVVASARSPAEAQLPSRSPAVKGALLVDGQASPAVRTARPAATSLPALWAAGLVLCSAWAVALRRWTQPAVSLAPLAMCSTSGSSETPPPPVLAPPRPTDNVVPVPRNPQAIAQVALNAALAAYKDGITQQRHEWLLPLIGATDLDDWPGGIQQQFKALLPMMEQFLRGLKAEPGLEGRLQATILDDADATASWEGEKLAAVAFPTAETLPELKRLAKANKAIILVNPQWQDGQVISDFGWGPWRLQNEEFVNGFKWVYYCKQLRINGDVVVLQRIYPGRWQVHVRDANDDRPCVSVEDERPSYQRLEEILRAVPGSMSSKSLFDRLSSEFEFNYKSMEPKDRQ